MLGTKLSEECCKYGAENTEDNILAKAASIYGDARNHVEKEQEDLNKLLLSQVALLIVVCTLGAARVDCLLFYFSECSSF